MVPTTAAVGDPDQDSATGQASSGDLTAAGVQDYSLDFGFMRELASQPVIRTQASASSASLGVRVHDKVWVSGLQATDSVRVRWTLHGPVAPVSGTCAKVKWKGSPVRSKGSFSITGNGAKKTAKVTLRKVGCYTYSAKIAATSTTLRANHKPGHPAETIRVLAKRSPVVNTGPAGWLRGLGMR